MTRRLVVGYARGQGPDPTARTAPVSLFQGGKPGLCRACRLPVKGGNGRGRWHPACARLYRAMRNPQELRKLVLERDHGVCAECRLNTLAPEKAVAFWRAHPSKKLRKLALRFHGEAGVHDRRVTYWDADHVVRVADGGGLSALLNVRTLCYWCHARKTHGADGRPTGMQCVPPVLEKLAREAGAILATLKPTET